MAEYNPFKDFNPNFTYYTAPEVEKVELVNPFDDSITDISSWASSILPNGNIRVSPNTPEAAKTFDTSFIDENAKSHSEPYLEVENTLNNSLKTYATKLNLQGNKKRAMEFFLSKGLSAHLAAGIVANLIGESNLNPSAINKSSGAYGYAQWLGDRKKKLFAKYGNNPTEEQLLEFIWEELNTSERRAFDRLLLTKSVDEAVNSFMKHFERPSLREMALSIHNRLKYGRELLS